MSAEQTRPRFGKLTRQDGSVVPLVFHPTDEPQVFVGRRAHDEQPVQVEPGDHLMADVIGPGQMVVFEVSDPGGGS